MAASSKQQLEKEHSWHTQLSEVSHDVFPCFSWKEAIDFEQVGRNRKYVKNLERMIISHLTDWLLSWLLREWKNNNCNLITMGVMLFGVVL